MGFNQLITELSGLIGWYPFTKGSGATLNDYSISGNDGTITTAVWKKITTGGYCLESDGDISGTNKVQLNSPIVLTGLFSISFWVNVNAWNAFYAIIGSNTSGDYWGVRDSTGSHVTMNIGGSEINFTSETILTGSWNHIIITRDSSDDIRAYINSVESLTGTINSSSILTTAHLLKLYALGTYDLDGSVTDIIIATSTWSEELINQIYRKTYRS